VSYSSFVNFRIKKVVLSIAKSGQVTEATWTILTLSKMETLCQSSFPAGVQMDLVGRHIASKQLSHNWVFKVIVTLFKRLVWRLLFRRVKHHLGFRFWQKRRSWLLYFQQWRLWGVFTGKWDDYDRETLYPKRQGLIWRTPKKDGQGNIQDNFEETQLNGDEGFYPE